jgi:hypothetical protein
MATPFRIKRSAVPNKRPQVADLELGELAFNFYDGRLFAKKDTAGVGVGTTVTLLNPWTENIGGGIYYIDGNVGIGTINPESKLSVVGISTFGDDLYVGGDLYVSDDISVDEVNTRNILVTGIATVTTLSVQSNFDVYDTTATFHSNVRIDGNLSIGGTTTTIVAQDLKISDRDIVLGIATDAFGNDISTDITANHGGIAIASTEGSPLVSLKSIGITTLPDTYKQIMWIAKDTFGIGTTDAWLFNYAVGVGSTQVPNGTILAVGNIHVTDNSVESPNANITNLWGTNLTYTIGNFGTANINVGIVTNISGINLNYSGVSTIATLNSTTSTLGNASASSLVVSGVTTSSGGFVGNLTGTASTASFATTAYNLTDAANIISGTVNSSRLSGTYNIDISGNAATATYALNAGITTSVIGGIVSVSQLDVSGISTLGTIQISSGIITATSGVVTYYGDGSKLQGVVSTVGVSVQDEGSTVGTSVTTLNFSGSSVSVSNAVNGISTITIASGIVTYVDNAGMANYATTAGIATYATSSGIATNATYATTSGISTNTIGGIASVTQLSVSGISTLGITSTANLTTQQLSVSGLSTFSGITTYTSSIFGTQASFTGIVTASSFSGNASSATYATTAGIATYATSSGIATYATTAGIATALQNSRTFEITGDIVASPISFDGTGNVSLAATIQPNSVALGGDTTGNYVTSITNGSYITGADGGSEGSTLTIGVAATSINTLDQIVARDSSGNFSAGTITANLTGTASTASFATTAYNLTDAANITTGTISSARLSGTYNIDISGNAATATYALNAGITTSVIGGISSVTQLQVTGVSTFTNGPVFIGSATSTGTASQPLQVTGGAYVSGSLGVGVTNPAANIGTLQVNGTLGLAPNSLVRQWTDSDVGTLKFFGTQFVSGASNSDSYGYSGGGLIAAITNGDGATLLDIGRGGGSPLGRFKIANTSGGNISLSLDNGSSTTLYTDTGSKNVLINNTVATGTASQPLQVTGGAYVSGNVGIGTINPTQELHVQGDVRITGAIYDSSNSAGTSGQVLQSIGTGVSWTTSTSGISVSDDTTTNATRYVLFDDTTSGSTSVVNVSSTKLQFNPSTGTLSATAFTSLSDKTMKKNIKPIQTPIELTKQLNGVRYDWIDTNQSSIGVIAQEIEQVLPEVVTTNSDGTKSVSYGNIIGLLIEAIKEQQVRIEEMERKLNA